MKMEVLLQLDPDPRIREVLGPHMAQVFGRKLAQVMRSVLGASPHAPVGFVVNTAMAVLGYGQIHVEFLYPGNWDVPTERQQKLVKAAQIALGDLFMEENGTKERKHEFSLSVTCRPKSPEEWSELPVQVRF